MILYTWHKIEGIAAQGLEENKLTEKLVTGKRIGLLKRGAMVYAFTAACPHAGASLCEGWVNTRGHIVCPDHNYHFDPANGRNTSGEGYKLFTYPVEIRDDEIFIGILNDNPNQ